MLSIAQTEFMTTPLRRINMLEGCISSGKTFICNQKAVMQVLKEREKEGLIFFVGRTLDTLETNVLAPLNEIYGNDFQYKKGAREAYLCGEKIHLRGCDNIKSETKIRGTTAKFIYCDELTLLNKEFISRCMGSLRVPGAAFLGSTNPDRADNFIKIDYIDRRKELDMNRWRFKMSDNPILTEEYKKNINLEYTGVLHDRFIKGLWVATSGLIYPFFANNYKDTLIDVDEYIKGKNPENKKKIIKYVSIGVDWGNDGTGNAAVAIGITANYEELIALDELMIDDKNLTPETLENKLCLFIDDITKKYLGAYVYCDNAIGTLTNGLYYAVKKYNIKANVMNCLKRPIMDRIVLNNKLIAQKRFKINKNCKILINALRNAVWKNDSKKDERAKDELNNSHIIDALEYSECMEHGNIEKAGHVSAIVKDFRGRTNA